MNEMQRLINYHGAATCKFMSDLGRFVRLQVNNPTAYAVWRRKQSSHLRRMGRTLNDIQEEAKNVT